MRFACLSSFEDVSAFAQEIESLKNRGSMSAEKKIHPKHLAREYIVQALYQQAMTIRLVLLWSSFKSKKPCSDQLSYV